MESNKIIGRKEEIKRLNSCLEREEPQLIAVYGRRRIGKTFLVHHFFNGRFDFRLTGIYDQPTAVQLKNFAIELSGHIGEEVRTPKDWMDAFVLLRKYIETRNAEDKTVVFLDEMPWMDTPRSGFLPAFEWFWNSYGSTRKNLIVIVAGSAASWMRINIDRNRGGLFNRLTCRIYLKPFTLEETEEYFVSRGIVWSRYDIVVCYMVMGGIPYYLSLLLPEMSVDQNIDNMFFRKRAELWDEFTFLYRTLFKNKEQAVRIAQALSQKRGGLTREEILEASGLPDNGRLTALLEDMEYSGFLRICDQYGSKKKQYQLSDYYSLFYFRFIQDNYGKDEHFWSHMLDNPARRAWAGLTFEQVCMDHVPKIKKKLGIAGVLSQTSVWQVKGDDTDAGAQIDMIIARRDRVINLCEIKFASSEYVIDKEYDLKLRNKMGTFLRRTKTKDTIQLTFISTYGVKKNKYSGLIQSEVLMDDLFAQD